MKIKTVCVCPPIPDRGSDWEAYDEDAMDVCGDPECSCRRSIGALVGRGVTEEEAVEDYVYKLIERHDLSVSEFMV